MQSPTLKSHIHFLLLVSVYFKEELTQIPNPVSKSCIHPHLLLVQHCEGVEMEKWYQEQIYWVGNFCPDISRTLEKINGVSPPFPGKRQYLGHLVFPKWISGITVSFNAGKKIWKLFSEVPSPAIYLNDAGLLPHHKMLKALTLKVKLDRRRLDHHLRSVVKGFTHLTPPTSQDSPLQLCSSWMLVKIWLRSSSFKPLPWEQVRWQVPMPKRARPSLPSPFCSLGPCSCMLAAWWHFTESEHEAR